MIETGNFKSKDGLTLFYRAPTVKASKVTVVIVHGFAEHSGRYDEILSAIEKKGYNPFAFDLRGHGLSEGRRGHINSFSEYIDDLDAAIGFAQKRSKSESVILLAHSMGGLIAACYAGGKADKVAGLIISSPLFGICVPVAPWKKRLGSFMSKHWPAFGLPNSIDANLLTHDELRAENYRSDPLIFHHVTARWFEEITKATDRWASIANKLQQPILLQLSGDDRIVSYEKNCEWYERNRSVDKTLHVYADFYHEIYNEKNRHEPIEHFLSWMQSRWPLESELDSSQPAGVSL